MFGMNAPAGDSSNIYRSVAGASMKGAAGVKGKMLVVCFELASSEDLRLWGPRFFHHAKTKAADRNGRGLRHPAHGSPKWAFIMPVAISPTIFRPTPGISFAFSFVSSQILGSLMLSRNS